MKAWAVVHLGNDIKQQMEDFEHIEIFSTRQMARDCKYFDEKIIRVEIKELAE